MTAIPATGYFTDSLRTNAAAKTAQDDMLAVLREQLGGSAEATLTIASGSVTPTVGCQTIDTEGAAAADDLTNIVTTNHPDGRLLLIRCVSAARVVTVKHNAGGAGQITLVGSADVVLNATTKWLLLKRNGANWEEVGRFGFAIDSTGGSLAGAGNLAEGAAVASASTTNIWVTDGNTIHITGTTTITSFGTAAQAGATRRLIFDDALILTNGANLILPGAANITTAAGDSCEVYADTTTQHRVVGYTRADGTALVLPSNVAVAGTFTISGDISPTQITADQDNYNPTGLSGATTLRLNSDASRNITGLQGGADGRIIVIHNTGSNNVVLKDESASSTAAYRFALTGDITLATDQAVVLQYDSTSSRWRAISAPSAGGDSPIDVQTASNSPSLDFTTGINSTYDEYIFVFIGIIPATNGVNGWIRVSQDGGSTWKSGATDYDNAAAQIATSGTLTNASTDGLSGEIKLWKPSSTAIHKQFSPYYRNVMQTQGGVLSTSLNWGGVFSLNANAVNGVRFMMSSGNIASGSILMYGKKKT